MPSGSVGNAYLNVVPKLEGNASTLGGKFGNQLSAGAQRAVSAGTVAIGNILSGMVTTVASSIGSSMSSAIGRVDTLNNFPKVMANMKISGEDARAAIEKVSAGIDGLPTSLDAAASAVQRFTAKNGDVGKSAEMFNAVNDAILAGGAPAEQQATALEQLAQSYAKGKMDMVEWRAVQSAMPAQIKQVGEAFGMSADEMGEALRTGSMSMDEFIDKIIELDQEGQNGYSSLHEQAQAATAGIGTAMANMQNRVNRAVGAVIDEIGQGNIAQALNDFSSSFINMAQPVIEGVKGLKEGFDLSGIGESFAPAAQALSDLHGYLFDVEDEAGNIVSTGLFHTLGNSLGEGLSGGIEAISSLAGEWLPRIQSAIEAAQPGFDAMGEAFDVIRDSVGEAAGKVGELAGGALDTYLGNLTPILQAVASAFKLIAGAAAWFVEGFKFAIDTASQSGVFDALGDAIGRLAPLFDALAPVVSTVAAIVGDVLGSAFVLAVDAITVVINVVADLVDAFSGIPDTVSRVSGNVTNTVNGVKTGISNAFSAISNTVGSVLNGVKSTVSSIWNSIKSTVTNVVNGIRSTVSNVFNGIKSTVSSIFNSIKGTVSSVWNGIKNAITAPINAAKSAVSSAISSISSIVRGVRLQLPHINLPHFSVSGGSPPWGIGGKGSLPSFSVSWYAKGGIVDGATLIGAGERGAELIWPAYDPYLSKYADAIASKMDGGSVTVNLNYNASDDANDMLRDLSRGIRQYRMAGAF